MAYEIQNTLRNRSTVRVTGASAVTLPLTAFSSAAAETVSSVKLAQVYWSTNNKITIDRDGSVLAILYNSGEWNLQSSGIVISNTSTGNVTITITGDGTCIAECTKEATYSPALG